jgi:hypothetical protein
MNSYDRFAHEQSIMRCWQITDDLDTLHEAVLESKLTQDGVADMLSSLKTLYQLRFDQLWDHFELSIRSHNP